MNYHQEGKKSKAKQRSFLKNKKLVVIAEMMNCNLKIKHKNKCWHPSVA